MDPGKMFQIITNSTLLATRLQSPDDVEVEGLQFSEPLYCLLMAEDSPPALRLLRVSASHEDGIPVRYSITAGNRDGLFTIDQRSGLITLAAPLDFELSPKHELVVAAEAGGRFVHAVVDVTVIDVNDNEPRFLKEEKEEEEEEEEGVQVTVVEEGDDELPASIAKVEAIDVDSVDEEGLVYSLGGDGMDGRSPGGAFFSIDPRTGELFLLRALDRDPPLGRDSWRLKVQVRDGQQVSPALMASSRAPRSSMGQHGHPQDSSPSAGKHYFLWRDPGTRERDGRAYHVDGRKCNRRDGKTANTTALKPSEPGMKRKTSERRRRKPSRRSYESQAGGRDRRPGPSAPPAGGASARPRPPKPRLAKRQRHRQVSVRRKLPPFGGEAEGGFPAAREPPAEGSGKRLRPEEVLGRSSSQPPSGPSGGEEAAGRRVPTRPRRKERASGDSRYVRRLGADGGGCRRYGFSEEEETPTVQFLREARRGRVHVAETAVTVTVKDVNDNAPVFPDVAMHGRVQENGPIDLSAGVVWAWDADDQQEAAHARLTYSIEKNVVEERSGRAIFAVDPATGVVSTAVCCLDRETTPEYRIQVAATDGGGLKGTGTMVVRLADVNDNPPRLTRDLWQVEVDETWGRGPPTNETLLQVTVADQDASSNYFFYQVVDGSGWGWKHFGMRTSGSVGHLFALETLDYEDAAQRNGFRFMVQVTDRGRGGWGDSRHTDTAWVEVRLRDVNDNPPQFGRPHAHVAVREDAAPGTLLASLPATDPDVEEEEEEGGGGVRYRVEGGWGALGVDERGGVRLWRALDREAPGGEAGEARLVAADGEGPSALSATATLALTVEDVNDCPPRLVPSPALLRAAEEAPASLLGRLAATDDDAWARGHGPPFRFSLAPSNPAHVLAAIDVRFDQSMDSGRGGAEVWTLGPVDREEYRQLTAEVVVRDAGGLAATHPVTIVIDDVNDNPMKPAAKNVYLWKTQGGGADAALGRVYVEDPDDWDLQDKSFSWAGPPHPLFTLKVNTGEIFASSQLREGRYELHFSVSDRVWKQRDVPANVTVVVRHLSPEALAHAVPVSLMPTTPPALASGWTPSKGGGGLGALTEAVRRVAGRAAEAVEIVSVYGLPERDASPDPTTTTTSSSGRPSDSSSAFACVWLNVRLAGGRFMEPVRLHGLLALHLQEVEKMMNLRVALEVMSTVERQNGKAKPGPSFSSPPDILAPPHTPSSVASLASMALPLQVVDTNLTSLVTPRLTRAQDCRGQSDYLDDSCTPSSCLNGGRCVRTDIGNRCVCPGGSRGFRCKVPGRTFFGSGWAWVRPPPPCLPTTLSLRLLTRATHALLLYSGPLAAAPGGRPPTPTPTPMMALQLVGGRPQVLLEGAGGPVRAQVNATLGPGAWHTIRLRLDHRGVSLMVDPCGSGWTDDSSSDDRCVARAPWMDGRVTGGWAPGSAPLQVGGLAHPFPQSSDFGWSNALVGNALDGCISHLTVNGEVVDLGEPAHSSKSVRGCRPQELACGSGPLACGRRGRCTDGLDAPRCECEPGWAGRGCATPTSPVSLGRASFADVALPFAPDPRRVTLQLRVRARGRPDGLLARIPAGGRSRALELRLRGGVACASAPGGAQACLEGFPVGDGAWHALRVGRHGGSLVVAVDDGDGRRRNETPAPPPAEGAAGRGGITLGGIPESRGLAPVAVHDDLQDCCIDDVRVSGQALSLPPSNNGTVWDQVMFQQNLESGCPSADFCSSTACLPPLSCHDSWRHATCSCGPGLQAVGGRCQDVDECVFQPCLFGGTCYNLSPGYHCACAPTHTGDNCEWTRLPKDTQPISAPMAMAVLTLCLLIIAAAFGGVLLSSRVLRRLLLAARGVAPRPEARRSPTGRKHLVTFQGPATPADEPMDMKNFSSEVPESSEDGSDGGGKDKPNLLRCPAITVDVVEVHAASQRSRMSFPPAECSGKCALVRRPADAGLGSAAQDDLRAYAYEGDGSPSGSLTSTVLGLRTESMEEDSFQPLVAEYGEVLDLLKSLPDNMSTLHTSSSVDEVGKSASGSNGPKIKETKLNIT